MENNNQAIFIGNPSEHLLGKKLDGGWLVTEKLPVGKSVSDGTGGNFTIAYKVRHDSGTEAFLKAMDYSSVFKKGGTSAPGYLALVPHTYSNARLSRNAQKAI